MPIQYNRLEVVLLTVMSTVTVAFSNLTREVLIEVGYLMHKTSLWCLYQSNLVTWIFSPKS